MEKLTDFGLENPIKKKEQERFIIKTRTAYCLWDTKEGIWMDLAVDLDEGCKAHADMVTSKKEHEDNYGVTFVEEN